MKTTKLKLEGILVMAATLFLAMQSATGQTLRVDNAASTLNVLGTSNLHDWDMKANDMEGNAIFNEEGGQLKSITNLEFQVGAESLKSGKSGMDKNAYKALNTDKHKNIVYEGSASVSSKKAANGSYEATMNGKLTVSGVTKSVSVPVKITKTGRNYRITGEKSLNMTSFGIEPPTALLGTVKTGEEITVKFNIIFD